VQAQESAYHALPWVRQLLALAQRPARDVQVKAIEALAELFLARLLPPRRLRTFERQALGAAPSERQLLEAWYEEGLKHVYAGFAQLVVHGTSDNVLHSKQLMVRMLANMLGGAPELERELLPALVNKLGDPEKKVASRLTHLMHALLQQHPAMKPVLLAEVQRFVLRPGMAERALYYACTFLNQLVLSRREPEVAQQLLRIYLALFSSRSSQDQPLDTKMLSSLLSGIHRAVPYCDTPGELLLGQLHALFRCAHSTNLATTVQALMVLGHAAQFDSATSDRFYRALYESILHPDLPTSAKQALLLNVLFKAMKADTDVGRLKAFAKRLMQACASAPPSFTCGCLLLLSEVTKAVPAIQGMVTQIDSATQRPKPTPPTAPATAAAEEGGGKGAVAGEASAAGKAKAGAAATTATAASSSSSATAAAAYTWDKRDPRHANAEGSGLWEAAALQQHYHPSVVQFVSSVLNGSGIRYAGDPLREFQLTPFLDKFVFKNPKRAGRTAGGSLMQPTASSKSSGLGTAEIAKLTDTPAAKVDEHDRFFHTYFASKRQAEAKAQARRSKKQDKKKGAEGEEGEEEQEEEEEAFARKLAENMMQDEAVMDDDSDDEDDLAALDGMDDDDDDESGEENGEEGEDDEAAFADMDGFGGDDDDDEDDDEAAAAAAQSKGKKAGKDKAPPKIPKQRSRKSAFADASEFSELLEAAADEYEGVNPHLAEWEEGRGRKRRKN